LHHEIPIFGTLKLDAACGAAWPCRPKRKGGIVGTVLVVGVVGAVVVPGSMGSDYFGRWDGYIINYYAMVMYSIIYVVRKNYEPQNKATMIYTWLLWNHGK